MDGILQSFYREHVPGGEQATIGALQELRAGWESEVWFFDATTSDASGTTTEQRVLRIFPGEVGVHKAAAEYAVLRRLHEMHYPVPAVFALATEKSPLGRPFMIMERVPGEQLWGPLFHAPEASRRETLLRLFCARMVELHQLDWRAFLVGAPESAQGHGTHVEQELERLSQWTEASGDDAFEPTLGWLRDHLSTVPPHEPAVVHLDLHPGNVLLGPDDTAVVLDWTQGAVSDPRLDLGWTLILTGAAEGWEFRGRILHEYERQSGERFPEIGYFEACAAIKRLGIVHLAFSDLGPQLGMREDIKDTMLSQRAELLRVYERLRVLTGLRITRTEELLG